MNLKMQARGLYLMRTIFQSHRRVGLKYVSENQIHVDCVKNGLDLEAGRPVSLGPQGLPPVYVLQTHAS